MLSNSDRLAGPCCRPRRTGRSSWGSNGVVVGGRGPLRPAGRKSPRSIFRVFWPVTPVTGSPAMPRRTPLGNTSIPRIWPVFLGGPGILLASRGEKCGFSRQAKNRGFLPTGSGDLGAPSTEVGANRERRFRKLPPSVPVHRCHVLWSAVMRSTLGQHSRVLISIEEADRVENVCSGSGERGGGLSCNGCGCRLS